MAANIVSTQEALEECLSLRKAVFVEEQGVPIELEVDDLDTIDAAIHVQLTDEAEKRTIGTARIKEYHPSTAKIQRVAIARDCRGAGYGRLLMDSVERACIQSGYRSAVLDAQLTAEGFYRRLGYQRTSDEVFLDAGIEHVHMTKNLTSQP